MVRPKRTRRIFFQPDITYFKPAGVPMSHLEETNLSFEELEAIRLIDSQGIDQIEAGKKMNISQSTLSRLLKQARKKLAEAITNGQAIKIQGGNFKMVMPGRGRGNRTRKMNRFSTGPRGICFCQECKYQEPQIRGEPCFQKKCPKCGNTMIKKTMGHL